MYAWHSCGTHRLLRAILGCLDGYVGVSWDYVELSWSYVGLSWGYVVSITKCKLHFWGGWGGGQKCNVYFGSLPFSWLKGSRLYNIYIYIVAFRILPISKTGDLQVIHSPVAETGVNVRGVKRWEGAFSCQHTLTPSHRLVSTRSEILPYPSQPSQKHRSAKSSNF